VGTTVARADLGKWCRSRLSG